MIEPKAIYHYLYANKDRLKKEYHLTNIGMFGSYQANKLSKKNDIDLLIDFKEDTNDLFSIKQAFRREIQSKFNIRVNLFCLKDIKSDLKDQIVSEAKYI